MSRSACLLVVCTVAAPGAALAAPAPQVIATCGDSQLAVVAGSTGTLPGVASAPELRATLALPDGKRWSFVATIGLVRLGVKTRTITLEDLRNHERKPPAGAKDASPSGLFVDLLVDDKKLILRHASEGEADPAYALDLAGCGFSGDAALAALVPPPTDPVGCAPAIVNAGYLTQVTRVAKLPEADAAREAQALCEDHQKTIEARNRLEAAISDRAARARVTARGPALLRTEEARLKAWNRIDACLGADPSKVHGVAALHDGEARERACYARIAAKP
jgi:hypothetical protein